MATVTGRTEVAPQGNITSRETGQTSTCWTVAKKSVDIRKGETLWDVRKNVSFPPALCHGTIGESREGAEEKHSFRADSCRGFGLIEPDDAKVSCPVPRGLGGRKAPRLPYNKCISHLLYCHEDDDWGLVLTFS